MKTLLTALILLCALAPSAQAQPAPEAWRGRSSAVVVDREDLDRRLGHLELLLRESERGRRGEEQGRHNEAFQELAGLRQWLSRAPDARDSSWTTSSRPPPPPVPPAPMRSAVSEGRLRDILSTMSREAFSSDKLRVLEMASRGDYFLVSQVAQALSQFPSSGDRLSVVRLLWPHVLDRQNAYQLNDSFPFSTDKQELQRIISG